MSSDWEWWPNLETVLTCLLVLLVVGFIFRQWLPILLFGTLCLIIVPNLGFIKSTCPHCGRLFYRKRIDSKVIGHETKYETEWRTTKRIYDNKGNLVRNEKEQKKVPVDFKKISYRYACRYCHKELPDKIRLVKPSNFKNWSILNLVDPPKW